jgi:hypothetical protein
MKKALVGFGGHAKEVMAQMGDKICYVINFYLGDRRTMIDEYKNDRLFFLKNQIEFLNNYKNSLSKIIFNFNIREEDYHYVSQIFDIVPKKIQNAFVEVNLRKNYGMSYGAWSDAFVKYKKEFDYYVFNEDDYFFVQNNWDLYLVNKFKTIKNCGYLCMVAREGNEWCEYKRHALHATGISSSEVLYQVYKKYGELPHAKGLKYEENEKQGQVQQSHSIIELGYDLCDVREDFKVEFAFNESKLDIWRFFWWNDKFLIKPAILLKDKSHTYWYSYDDEFQLIYKNKVGLISSYCDTQEKIDILEKNINIIKSHGLDVIVISPFNLPKTITNKCDYFFITKDNPILDWPIKSMINWKSLNFNGIDYGMSITLSDYGFAGLNQIKQLSQIALNFNYDQFFHMIYDIKIDENVINGFHSNKTNSVYPSKRGNEIWDVGLHYMIFNKSNLEKFISYINLETYLGVEDGDAFAVLHSIKNELNYIIEGTPVEDEIYYYSGIDFFNLSPIEGLKFFIEKNDENPDTIKIFFYDVKGEVDIELSIGGNQSRHKVYNSYVIDLGFTKFNMKPVYITYNDINYELTEIIKNIKHNKLKIG